MNFDEPVERRDTHSDKWDRMENIFGVSPDDGLAMWVADMDFRSAPCIQDAVREMHEHGVYGYYWPLTDYHAAIAWWMQTRHGWAISPDWIFTTQGLGNAVALVLQAFTNPGDGVVLFTPVYHSFGRITRAAGRKVVECPLTNNAGRYEMDFAAADAKMTGTEKAVILCSPHNPGGRVWTRDELRGVADFCTRHDLLLISDEIHHDLVYPGARHMPMPLAAPEITERLIMLTAPSKTFNIPGTHTGNVIIEDARLRRTFTTTMKALNVSPNSFGVHMTTAAYSPAGAEWADALTAYLDGNRKLFDDGMRAIPGVAPMELEATYLSWVDFSATGMAAGEIHRRVEGAARIAANHGDSFGTGGETFMRFNLGTQRARIAEAVSRIQDAFADLQ